MVGLSSGGVGEPFLGCDPASLSPVQHLPPICGMPFHYAMDGAGKLTWGIHSQQNIFDGNGVLLATGAATRHVATGSSCGEISMARDSRTYLGDACIGQYQPAMYTNWPLLGRWISFTVDVSQTLFAGNTNQITRNTEGCWGEVMLVHMHDNGAIGTTSKDYWCDADKTNGRKCQEISISANSGGLRVNARTDPTDPIGVSLGVGGNANDQSWAKDIYGSDKKINTKKPFSVAVSFKVGNIMEVVLTQGKETSGVLSATVAGLDAHITHGMTPVFSYHQATAGQDLKWLGGTGAAAVEALAAACAATTVSISDLTNNALPR